MMKTQDWIAGVLNDIQEYCLLNGLPLTADTMESAKAILGKDLRSVAPVADKIQEYHPK